MLDIRNPWQQADAATNLAAHMGVFELADSAGEVVYVGYAGASSRFGLRSEVQAALASQANARAFRCEVNTAYLTRFQELVMLHRSRGSDPALPDTPLRFGTLRPA